MQHLMLGASGSGKGYEACVYQILPALQKGRRVITNMPLDLEKWAALDATYPDLIELRTRPQPIRGTWNPTREEGAYELFPDGRTEAPSTTARCFAGVWDYYTDWRNPDTGQGPLFVIDEAQYVIPCDGADVQVEEWTALHRHFNADVIWITQSYGKLSRAVRDNVQMVYRLRKKVAWGQPDRYIRKVQDGLRGEVMNVGERKYESRYFGLWKSHTQGVAAEEFNAEDVKPIWRHWSFMGAAAMAVLFVVMLLSGKVSNPMEVKVPTQQAQKVAQVQPQKRQDTPPAASATQPQNADHQQPPAPPPQEEPQPFQGLGIHIGGSVTMRGETRYFVAISQNGQIIHETTEQELIRAGYVFEPVSDCAARVTWKGQAFYIRCDTPTQTAVAHRRGA